MNTWDVAGYALHSAADSALGGAAVVLLCKKGIDISMPLKDVSFEELLSPYTSEWHTDIFSALYHAAVPIQLCRPMPISATPEQIVNLED